MPDWYHHAWPPLALTLLWAGWLVQALLAYLMVKQFAKRLGQNRPGDYRLFTPPVSLLAPFKGLGDDVGRAVEALLGQDYPAYRLLLLVESRDDPAFDALHARLGESCDRPAVLLVSGLAPPTRGQKVHNQLMALAWLEGDPAGADVEAIPFGPDWSASHQTDPNHVWAFADSDAVPDDQWIRRMVGPLTRRDEHGMTTGYRWLVPEPGPDGTGPTWWSHLASAINGQVACVAGNERWNQAWGGAMAIRVETAKRGQLFDCLHGAITDDYPFTQMVNRLGLTVYFVRDCLVASPVHFTWPTLLNFGRRQYLITRVYAWWIWSSALAVVLWYLAGWASLWGYVIAGLVLAGPGTWLIVPAVVWGMGHVLQAMRAHRRRVGLTRAFPPEVCEQCRVASQLDRWATPLLMAVHALIMLSAGCGRKMTWRGQVYILRGPQAVERRDASRDPHA